MVGVVGTFAKLLVKKPFEVLRLVSYTYTQTHKFDLIFTPWGSEYHNFLVPLPIETRSQQVYVEVNMTPSAERLTTDIYDIAVFKRHELEKNKQVKVSFSVTVQPISARVHKNFLLTDYTKIFSVKKPHADSDNIQVREIATSLAGGEKRVVAIMKKLYEHVLNALVYGNPIEGLYSYKNTLVKDKVDCGGFCMLLSSLLGVFNIPHRLVVGFLVTNKKEKSLSMHVWLEVFMPDGSIFPLDPSIDWRRRHGQTTRWGGFGYVGSDRIIMSYGYNIEVKVGGKTRIFELLQNPVVI